MRVGCATCARGIYGGGTDGCPLDLQMNESAILGTKLSVQVARCVTWRIARCHDPDALFKVYPPA